MERRSFLQAALATVSTGGIAALGAILLVSFVGKLISTVIFLGLLAAGGYFLLQQQFGAGYTVTASPRSNLRVGLAENVFDVWETTAPESHFSKTAESVFLEADWKLPWRMTLTERGAYYYSLNSHIDGWENKLELDKKLTETFAVGIRHETRQNDPGVRVQDYTLTKFYMGIDF